MWLIKLMQACNDGKTINILMVALAVNSDIIIAKAAKRSCYLTVLHSVTTQCTSSSCIPCLMLTHQVAKGYTIQCTKTRNSYHLKHVLVTLLS